MTKKALWEIFDEFTEYMMASGSALVVAGDNNEIPSLQGNIEYVIGYIMHSARKHEGLDSREETGAKVMKEATQYFNHGYRIRAVSTSMLMGQFRVINIVFTTGDDDPEYLGQWRLDDENGVLGYVYNMDAPDLSELGYIYFEKRHDGTYHRIA